MRICKNCNAEMPDEAHICLNCFTVCENGQATVLVQSKTKTRKVKMSKAKKTKLVPISLPFSISNKRAIMAGVMSIVILISCLFIPIDNKIPVENENQPSNTEDNSANNTNTDGSVETTTQQDDENKTLFDILIKDPIKEATDKKEENKKDDGKEETTAEEDESSFWDIFKDDEDKEDITTTTTSSTTTTTTEPSTETTTESKKDEITTTTTTKPDTQSEFPAIKYEDWEYTVNENNKASITKYIGNDKDVTIPTKIDGYYVTFIDYKTFYNNDTIENVYIERSDTKSTISTSTMFVNCKNAKSLTLPKNTSVLLRDITDNCTSFEYIDTSNSSYLFEDGALYSGSSGNRQLLYYCDGYKAESFKLRDDCTSVLSSNLFQYNPYIKKIYIGAGLNSTQIRNLLYFTPEQLEAVYIDDNHPTMFDVDGVVYGTYRVYVGADLVDKKECICFPQNYQGTSHTVPKGYYLKVTSGKVKNIETIKMYNGSTAYFGSIFPNLKTLYLEEGHSQAESLQSEYNVVFFKEN